MREIGDAIAIRVAVDVAKRKMNSHRRGCSRVQDSSFRIHIRKSARLERRAT